MSYKSNQVDRVQPLEIFRREAAQVINTKDGLTDSDLDVLMKFLARDKGEIAYDYEASLLLYLTATELTQSI